MKDPNAAKLERHRGVYWLPCSATEHADGAPLCPNPRVARLAVDAPPITVRDPDATPMQLQESEETRRPKHRALPVNVSKEEFDAHQFAHFPRARFEWRTGAGCGQTRAGGCQHGSCRELGRTADEFCGSDVGG